MNLNSVPISVLDLSFVREGDLPAQALLESKELAQLADQLGYKRFWLAEHHNMKGIASAATSVAIGYVAGATSRIRVGAGGIMLPNHAPLVIAEQFGTLESLYPGRIDLGLGRAPGTDMLTARALRRDKTGGVDTFPDDVKELLNYFAPSQPNQAVHAVPGEGLEIPVLLLGSSGFSSMLAAQMGLPFGFASHFAPDHLMAALQQYRQHFQPSQYLAKPYCIVAINVIVADTDEEAQRLFTSAQQGVLALLRGRRPQMQPPIDSLEGMWNEAERVEVQRLLKYSFVGNPETVATSLRKLLEETQADELITTARIYDLNARKRSLELLASVQPRLTR